MKNETRNFQKSSEKKKKMKQGLKLSSIYSLWQYYFGLRKPAKFSNLWYAIENQTAYLDEAI